MGAKARLKQYSIISREIPYIRYLILRNSFHPISAHLDILLTKCQVDTPGLGWILRVLGWNDSNC